MQTIKHKTARTLYVHIDRGRICIPNRCFQARRDKFKEHSDWRNMKSEELRVTMYKTLVYIMSSAQRFYIHNFFTDRLLGLLFSLLFKRESITCRRAAMHHYTYTSCQSATSLLFQMIYMLTTIDGAIWSLNECFFLP
jgi:hypothetical protein